MGYKAHIKQPAAQVAFTAYFVMTASLCRGILLSFM
jgi:hypothetical protein